MDYLHAFLEWIYFDVNPIPWTYVFIAVPLFFVMLVRAIHYWPTAVHEERDVLFGSCMAAVLWGLVLAAWIVYIVARGFVYTVRWVWPPPLPPKPIGVCEGELCSGECNNPHCDKRSAMILAMREVETLCREPGASHE